mgnify:CR=1 FL=1
MIVRLVASLIGAGVVGGAAYSFARGGIDPLAVVAFLAGIAFVFGILPRGGKR